MISAVDFCAELDHHHVDLATGVPCGYLRGPLRLLAERPHRYLPAANEGAALATAAGAELTGRRCAVLVQNSGLGNLINPLTTLIMPYRIPVLVIMTLRGRPSVADDEPQHAYTGASTTEILSVLGLRHWTLEPSAGELCGVLGEAEEELRAGRPAFVLIPRGVLDPQGAGDGPDRAAASLACRSAIEALRPLLTGSLVFATTGRIHRELYDVADAPGNFYMAGSMGHAAALGVGAAVSRPDRRVVVLDGDGAALMHLGTLAVAGSLHPANMVHVVLDNRGYGSTGGQPVPGPARWADIGRGAGYADVTVCRSGAEVADAAVAEVDGPRLLVVEVAPHDRSPLPRPTDTLTLPQQAARIRTAARLGG